MSASEETERLAWVVLKTVNEAQAKGSTVRFVVSRDPEVAAEKLGMDPDGIQIQAVEEYLLERGYLPPARAGLTRGSYTITPVGFDWLNEGPPTLSEKPEMATDEPGKAQSAGAVKRLRRAQSSLGGVVCSVAGKGERHAAS